MEPEPVVEDTPAPASERPVRAAAQKAAQKREEEAEAAAKKKAASGKATAAALQKKLAAQKEAATAVEAAQKARIEVLVVNDRIGASAGCAEVDGEVLGWLREATEAEVAAAVECDVRAYGSARDAACLPFEVVGELRRKLGPIALAVLLLFMGVGMMNIRVSAEFPSSRQRAAFS